MNPKAICAIGAMSVAIGSSAIGENLIENGSFENAAVIESGSNAPASGNPETKPASTWTHFQSMDRTGKVKVGLTREIARTGKQSIYVQFDGAAKTRQALLMSELIPIKEFEKYHVSIWGRVDSKRPLSLDEGRPYMTLDVEYYSADQATQLGEVEVRTQMIPGMAGRLLFLSSKWSVYETEFMSPAHAEFMKITFNWFSSKREGPADGIIYFDDVAVDGVRGALKPSLDPPEEPEDADDDDAADPKAAKPATPPPANDPTKK